MLTKSHQSAAKTYVKFYGISPMFGQVCDGVLLRGVSPRIFPIQKIQARVGLFPFGFSTCNNTCNLLIIIKTTIY